MHDLMASLNSRFRIATALRQNLEEPTDILIARNPELTRRAGNLLRTVSKIELMLNRSEKVHQQLNALISEAVHQLPPPSPGGDIEERIDAVSRDMIQVSQAILKREWVRVSTKTRSASRIRLWLATASPSLRSSAFVLSPSSCN